MKLYLLRHAQANTADKDPRKGLSEAGLAEIRKVAAYVGSEKNIKVRAILHSGKTRAQQTAEIMAAELDPSRRIMLGNNLEPKADPTVWVERALLMEEDVMLVGHLPHLGRLAACLVNRDENKDALTFATATLACLSRAESGNWQVEWLVSPETVK